MNPPSQLPTSFFTQNKLTFRKSIRDFPLLAPYTRVLTQNGYDTIDDLAGKNVEELAKELKLTLAHAESIIAATQRRRAAPLTQSGAALMSTQSKRYSTYCKPLDSLIDGGVRPGYILEISGPPGSPKESLAINIVRCFVEAEHDVLFLDMQNMTTATRLKEMLNKLDTLPQHYESQISHLSIFNLPVFLIFLNKLLSYLQERPKIRLVVFNSLWFPFQSSSDLPLRTKSILLQRMQETLSKVCASTSVSVVATTQLATKLVKDDGTAGNFETGSKAILVPQPGNSYLPPGKSFRVIIVPHSRTEGILRLLAAPAHVRTQNPDTALEQEYRLLNGFME